MSGDKDLRRLERAHRAEPLDAGILQRYVTALLRAGDLNKACAALSIRWEVDSAQLDGLWWRSTKLTPDSLRELVADDLAQFDPFLLAKSWPRRKDGEFRLNTTRYLRRYRAHEPGEEREHRRLILIAWTPGTQSLEKRPSDRGKHLITVGLETRATTRKLLPASKWRS